MKGKEGQSVTLECPYPPQHRDNRKFLCKGERLNNCTEVATDHEVGSNNSRFSLQDDTSTSSFSVTVTELEAGDAGMYWCGSDAQWSVANYTKIWLSGELGATLNRRAADFPHLFQFLFARLRAFTKPEPASEPTCDTWNYF